jgi:hypothetical protein
VFSSAGPWRARSEFSDNRAGSAQAARVGTAVDNVQFDARHLCDCEQRVFPKAVLHNAAIPDFDVRLARLQQA